MLEPWKTVRVKTAYDTLWLKLRLETVELADGTIVPDYHVVEYNPVVFVFVLTTEIPAGAKSGETLEAVVRRELLGVAQELEQATTLRNKIRFKFIQLAEFKNPQKAVKRTLLNPYALVELCLVLLP